MTTNTSQLAAYIWNLADLLRGDFKQSQYGRVILPFTILRRLECVLEARTEKVLAEVEKLAAMELEEEAREKFLRRAAKQSFFNTSPMDLSKLGSADIKSNLLRYVESFSRDAREIFEHFRFDEFVAALDQSNLLFKVVQKVAATDLHPEVISNEIFVTDELTESDLINYANTISDKISENAAVMKQIENNSPEQAMLGDFASALDDAVMESSEAHQNQMRQVLGSKEVAAGFQRVVFDLLLAGMKAGKRPSSRPPTGAGSERG